ncbi:MAG: subtype I-B CRISPR-associated endonuclease Cas1 [Caldisericum sp. CG2_30_36_11]|nr:MAG: subtype I-B CRISPR-associated endonuclease Cas1 [Caldisericum sp. CG2_30_36_11]
MKGSIFVFSNGELKRKQNTIYFEGDKGIKKFIPVENTAELHLFGEVTINKKVLEFLSQNEIILHFYNYYGYYVGTYYPREHYNSGFMILKQAECYLDKEKRLELAKRFVWGACKNIEKVLNYYNMREISLKEILLKLSPLEDSITSQHDIESLMAIEGNIREIYYSAFDLIVNNESFVMDTRTKRPPRNRMNALISFGNSLMYTTVLSEIYKTHLDPRIGFLHATNFRRFTLNLDVAEIFKPIIVDRIIFQILNKGMIKPDDFNNELGGLYLKEGGRKVFIEKFEERLATTIKHRKIGKEVSYRRLIRIELYKIEKHLMTEEVYEPFISEW